MAKKKKTAKRGGGRKPGSWTLVTPDALRGWREKNKLSRGSVATTMGVSSTSIQNWETGRSVATAKLQQRLADLMKSPQQRASSPAPAATNGATPRRASEGDPTLIQATAAIVVEAIKSGGKGAVSPRDLGLLIRTVRDALA
jgi:DNA-binding transcriptional regulator YiaG